MSFKADFVGILRTYGRLPFASVEQSLKAVKEQETELYEQKAANLKLKAKEEAYKNEL